MKELLMFDRTAGKKEMCEADGRIIEYYAWKGLSYCENPLDPIQTLNLFMPSEYQDGRSINGYSAETAPIFLPNTVGGYMPGPADEPGLTRHGEPNAIFCALEHGYVVASGGVRGRTSGKKTEEFFEGSKAGEMTGESGRMTGRAPAFIVDYKAIIRYLRYNRARIPGNTDRIVTNGTSAGGALSALAGATGNSKDYDLYLKEIGALEERDEVFAASCYCPIINLEHADAAYEWLFSNEQEYHHMKFVRTEHGVHPIPDDGMLTEKQSALARELKALFPAYVNELKLKDPALHKEIFSTEGSVSSEKAQPAGAHENLPDNHLQSYDIELSLDDNGEGSFRDYVVRKVLESANQELRTHDTVKHHSGLMVRGSEVERQDFLTIENGTAVKLDFDAFAHGITRMKPTPAFDALNLSSAENEEFGTETVEGKHFTELSQKYTEIAAEMADPQIIRMMNPMSYIGQADTAKYWRIRHGVFDRDTSIAIPVILALTLENSGYQVDFKLPWGLPHSGDYDLPELFAWIDGLCKKM